MNIYDYLYNNTIKYKNKNALIFNRQKITYYELYNFVNFYSNFFYKKHNLTPGKKITILMENSLDYIILLLIAARLKLTVQTLGTYYSEKLIQNRLKKFNPNIIFSKKHLKFFFHHNNKQKLIFFEYDKDLILFKNFKNVIPNFKKKLNDKFLAVDSSGTTGNSKTVIFSEKCKIQRSLSAKINYKLNCRDIFIATAPFDHSVGHRQIFLPIILGSTNIILKNFHPKIWLKNIKQHKVTFTFLISTQITKLLETVNLNKQNIKSIKNFISVSTKLNKFDKKKLLKHDFNLHEMYGTCEVGTVTSINLKRETMKNDSVGKALKGNKILIINKNKICKSNKIGEIVSYTPYSFKEYYNLKKNNSDLFYKKYFRTGDLGYLDNEGYLYYMGRKKNLVKINGLNVYPEEIENKIRKYLNLKNFIILGSNSIHGKEQIIMFIEDKYKKNSLKLQNFFNSKLEKYEVPNKILYVKKLPRTNLGKVNISKLSNYAI